MPMNANGSSLRVETNYGGSMETHREARETAYGRNQQREPRPEGQRRKVIVVDKDKKTKVTYNSTDEDLLKAAEADAKSRGVASKKARKPRGESKRSSTTRAKKTTKTDTDK